MLHAGYLRTPTSCELLIATPNLDFIDRAQIVRTLAANRPVGLQADRAVAGVGVRVTHGPFLCFAEAMWVALDSSDVPDQEIWGYQGGAGWTINRLIQPSPATTRSTAKALSPTSTSRSEASSSTSPTT